MPGIRILTISISRSIDGWSIQWKRPRRFSASCSSRVRLEVRIDRRLATGADRAELRDRDLEVGEHLEQERLELLVGAVDLVDQQHDGLVGVDRLEQRPTDQELGPEQLVLGDRALLRGTDVQQLARVVPLVDGVRDVEPLVALEADQPGASSRPRAPSPPRSCRRPPHLRAGAASRARAPGRAPSRGRGRAGSRPRGGRSRARRSCGKRSSSERSWGQVFHVPRSVRSSRGESERWNVEDLTRFSQAASSSRSAASATDRSRNPSAASTLRQSTGSTCSSRLPSTMRSATKVSGSKAMPARSRVRPRTNASRASSCSAFVSECPSAISRSWRCRSAWSRCQLLVVELRQHRHRSETTDSAGSQRGREDETIGREEFRLPPAP